MIKPQLSYQRSYTPPIKETLRRSSSHYYHNNKQQQRRPYVSALRLNSLSISTPTTNGKPIGTPHAMNYFLAKGPDGTRGFHKTRHLVRQQSSLAPNAKVFQPQQRIENMVY